MKKTVSKEEEEELLTFKSGLGLWKRDPSTVKMTYLDVAPFNDDRYYEIEIVQRSFSNPIRHHVNLRDAQAKLKSLQQSGYNLILPQYPELSQFFHNGKPKTQTDLINELELPQNTEDRSGVDLLLQTWK